MRSTYWSLPLALIVAACSDKPPAAPPAVVFEGMPLRGTAPQAKAAGFTECTGGGGDGYTCTRSEAVRLVGVVPRRTQVELQYPPETKPADVGSVPLERLSFAGVKLTFGPTPYDIQCVNKNGELWVKPISCRTGDAGIEYVSHRLLEAGWASSGGKAGWYKLIHPTELVEVTVNTNDHSATLNEATAQHRDLVLSAALAKKDRAAAEQKAADAVKASMQK